MRRSPVKGFFLLLAFLGYFFAGFGEARELVWCVATSGETRLERLAPGGCDSPDPCEGSHSEESLSLIFQQGDPVLDHCSECFDLPALSASLRHSPRDGADTEIPLPLPVALPTPTYPVLKAEDFFPRFRPQLPSASHPALMALRTVVLRN